MRLRRILTAFAVLASAGTARAQGAPPVRRLPGRVIGVFDDATGQPVVGAVVEDVLTGWSAQTSITGTVALFYVDSGGTLIRIKKLGYVPKLLPVRNSPRDTIPITIVLEPVPTRLPAAVTTARSQRGAADTVRRLELSGFYDRRHTTGAPSVAFVTEDRIARFTLVSDVPRITGRGFCTGNLYLDGSLLTIPEFEPVGGVRTQPIQKQGIDFLINPSEILAIEFYRPSEVPAEYNRTAASQICGATLIWTK